MLGFGLDVEVAVSGSVCAVGDRLVMDDGDWWLVPGGVAAFLETRKIPVITLFMSKK